MKIVFLVFLICSGQAMAQTEELDSITLLKLIPKSWVTRYFASPALDTLPNNRVSEEIKYGHELITKTAYYIGPNGTVGRYAGNRMNCTNCHLDGGRRLFGGSFSTTHGRYPAFRPRDNIIISLADRVNYCLERPHNGKWLPHESREMRAILVYIKWLGQNHAQSTRRFGDKLMDLRFLSRPASPEKGRVVYQKHCQTCHGQNGEGTLDQAGKLYTYPPLWGPDSYSIGSSMHRVRPAAAFIKANMPHGTTWENPILTDEEAFDVAAFINDDRIHPRPQIDISKDYPDLFEKPIDYPYGPYVDNFSAEQHKFGPWEPIRKSLKSSLKERWKSLEPEDVPLLGN
jgi:thiosulfate dehydrogenase